MGVPPALAREAIRLSLGRDTDGEHLARVVHVLRSLQSETAAAAA
jgi:cysteine desulfurase